MRDAVCPFCVWNMERIYVGFMWDVNECPLCSLYMKTPKDVSDD